jgi:glycosyltransferase involved in cell wall biosynthesis
LDALISDDYPDKEIIVCDGASTDGTVELLRSYGKQVRWVSEKDGGEFQARNKALRMATGTIIRNLSDDDIPVPGTLAVGVRYLEARPDVDILFGQARVYYVRETGEKVLNDVRRRTQHSVTLKNFIYLRYPYAISESAFFRRSVVARIGEFDIVRGADYEYWARAAYRGLGLAVADEVFVDHYRFEAGERELRTIYRDLLGAAVMLADRYGSRWDKWYVRGVFLPYLRLKFDIVSSLPADFAMRLRARIWRLRNGLANMREHEG